MNRMTEFEKKLQAAFEHYREACFGDEAAVRQQELESLTTGLSGHPQWYDGPCNCDLCLSYAAQDGEHDE